MQEETDSGNFVETPNSSSSSTTASAVAARKRRRLMPSVSKVVEIMGIVGGICGVVALLWQLYEFRLGRAEVIVAEPATPIVESDGNLRLQIDLTNLGERTVYVRHLKLIPEHDDWNNKYPPWLFAQDTIVAIEAGSYARFTGPPHSLLQTVSFAHQDYMRLEFRTTRQLVERRIFSVIPDRSGTGEYRAEHFADLFENLGVRSRLVEECSSERVPPDKPLDLFNRRVVHLLMMGPPDGSEHWTMKYVLKDSLRRHWSPRQQVCWLTINTEKHHVDNVEVSIP